MPDVNENLKTHSTNISNNYSRKHIYNREKDTSFYLLTDNDI